jgi:AcrR family transcriptional regulator
MSNFKQSAVDVPKSVACRSTDRRVVRTRKAIREAFLKLMETQDYQKITISSIAREADVDRKTFYLHYDSVSDLVDEIVYDEAETMVERCRGAFSVADRRIDVAALFRGISRALAPDMAASRRVLAHISLSDVLDRLEASLVEVLVADNPLGISREDPYLPYIVSFFCAGIIAVYRRWLLNDSTVPLDDLAAVTNTCMIGGIDKVLSHG